MRIVSEPQTQCLKQSRFPRIVLANDNIETGNELNYLRIEETLIVSDFNT